MRLTYEEAVKAGLKVCSKCEKLLTLGKGIVDIDTGNLVEPQMWSKTADGPLHACVKLQDGTIYLLCGATNYHVMIPYNAVTLGEIFAIMEKYGGWFDGDRQHVVIPYSGEDLIELLRNKCISYMIV